MKPRLRFLALATVVLICLASAAEALEKTEAPFDLDRDDWNRGTSTCQVVYYNTCQGWVWIWGGWSPGDRFGVTFQACCAAGYGFQQLTTAYLYFWTGSPAGYGFTGTVDVWAADANGCPTGTALDTRSHLPYADWNTLDYSSSPVDVSGADFVITYTTNPTAIFGDPMAVPTDHPAAGPTGVASCGVCFPTTRVSHTFYFGTATTPVCPGSTLADELCDAELFLDVSMACATTAVEADSWAKVKQLYR